MKEVKRSDKSRGTGDEITMFPAGVFSPPLLPSAQAALFTILSTGGNSLFCLLAGGSEQSIECFLHSISP